MLTARPNNNRFYWLKANTLDNAGGPRGPVQNLPAAIFNPKARAKSITAKILSGAAEHTTISVKSPSRTNTIWLTPDMIDFGVRLQVRVGARRVFNDFVESKVEHILDDLRLRGDRQRVYHARIDLQ